MTIRPNVRWLLIPLVILALIILALIFKEELFFAWLWLKVEAPMLKKQLYITLERFIKAFIVVNLAGISLGLAIRYLKWLEALLTHWLLSALAFPWLVIIMMINMMARLSNNLSLWLGVMAAIPSIAYAFRPLANPKMLKNGFLNAYRMLFFAIAISEMLHSDSGIGSQIRFFFLFWNPSRLAAYAFIVLLLWLLVEILSRLSSFFISRYMMTSKGNVASPRSPA